MSALSIEPTFPIFTDIDGQPLDSGYVYIGTAGSSNPLTSPQTAYWDAALTQVVTQPVRTRGGYPLNGASIGRLYVAGDYSILVTNRVGATTYSATNATERISGAITTIDASNVTFTQAGSGAVTRTARDKMRDVVSVLDFGADPTGATVCSAAIQNAIDSLPNTGGTVRVPTGVYLATNIRIDGSSGNKTNVTIAGDGYASHIKKPDQAALTTDADRRSNVLWALRGNGHQVVNLKVEGNYSRGAVEPPYVTKHTLGDVFGSAGRAISVAFDGTSSTGAANDRVFTITVSGAGQTSSSVNISFDVAAGYVTEVTSQVFNETTGAGYMNAYQLDNDYAYRGGVYINGEQAPIEACVVQNCEVTDTVYGAILVGAGPLFASEAYFGSFQARIIGNYCHDNYATHIGGGKKVKAVIANNVLGYTTSSGIRCDEGSDECTIVGNSIDCADKANSNGGVSIYKSDKVSVSGNFITRTLIGVTSSESDRTSVVGNNIYDCGVGIGFNKVDYGVATGNVVDQCSSDGFRLTSGSNNVISNNTVTNVGADKVDDTSTASVVSSNPGDTGTDAEYKYNQNVIFDCQAGGTVSVCGTYGAHNFEVTPGSGTIINQLVARGGSNGTSSAPSLSTDGSTTDIDMRFLPKGAGKLRFGTHTATVDTPISGYIEIKDAGGTLRKLAVIS